MLFVTRLILVFFLLFIFLINLDVIINVVLLNCCVFSRKKQSTITFLVSKFNNNSSLCRWIVDSLTLDCLPYRVRIQWICFRCQLFVYFRFLLKKVNKQLYVSGFFFKLINFCIACMMVNGSTMTHRTGNLKKKSWPKNS